MVRKLYVVFLVFFCIAYTTISIYKNTRINKKKSKPHSFSEKKPQRLLRSQGVKTIMYKSARGYNNKQRSNQNHKQPAEAAREKELLVQSTGANIFHYALLPKFLPSNTTTVLLISSDPGDMELRNVIRDTWCKEEYLFSNMTICIFVLGMPVVQNRYYGKIVREHRKFGDILVDSTLLGVSNNQPRKSVSALFWLMSHLPFIPNLCCVAKTDVHSYTNAQHLNEIGEELLKSSLMWIVGCVQNHWTEFRTNIETNFKRKLIDPIHVNGSYMLSVHAVKHLINIQTLMEVKNDSGLPAENVYITGIVREREKVSLIANCELFQDNISPLAVPDRVEDDDEVSA